MNKRLSTLTAALAGLIGLAGIAAPAHAAKDVVVAVQSNFTSTDPYDANDTLSQAVAKSFYQGLYGFDKDLKMVPVLAESHMSIHTWPEKGYAALDVFVCGDCQPQKAIPVLRRAFLPDNIQCTEMKRGLVL